ncbi:BON domain-containing protein [Parapedobacter koreensis]|uniref:Osmotically-inducible protein OsmY, contains BON domain n=1 Tax=Parapedobacter koreensis TaxID=332977 RepID=A0A1H7I2M1_9SPHI|nr:BON domain-containing protein [Parapedobacter koreensis]SEK56843.1 Osmotically-inducible protein OsmY, contains BON domain [Parapedobacter koreensis]
MQRDVMDELNWDPMVAASEIGVSAKDGVITLSGYVDSYSKKYAAEKAAKRVNGVLAVAEDIEVKFSEAGRRDDTAIAEAILNAFKWNTLVPESKLKVKVDEGWVTLEGTVDWQFQKNTAYKAVRDIAGVKGVSNLIALKPRLEKIDIEKTIRQALHRRASVNAENIRVRTEGGKVILNGKASTWNERREVEKAVWSSPGVTEVEDNIAVTAL